MANAIQIKRRSSSGDPGAPNASNLKWGELAFNEADNTLYYGYGSGTNSQSLSVPSIGGSGAYSLRGGTNATGVWPISITGNAATVTNGVTYTGNSIEGYIPRWDNSSHVLSQGYQISTNLSTNNSDAFIPRADAVKTYVDSVKQGLDIKDSVRVATTENFSNDSYTQTDELYGSSNFALEIDGISLVAGDRFLVKNADNGGAIFGIWKVEDPGSVSTPFIAVRPNDFDSNDKISAGAFTFVEEGIINGDTGWVLTTNDPIDVFSNQVWSQFSAAGQIYDGSGLYKQGNIIGVGQGDGITVSANAVAVNAGSGLTADANGVHVGVNGGLTLNADSISVDSTVLRNTGDQVVSGIKTFENTAIFNSGIDLVAGNVSQCDYIAVWEGAADPSSSSQSLKNISVSQFLTDLNLNNVDNTSLGTWPGTTNITTLGTIVSGTWSANTIAVNKGGTGQTSYTDGQLLIGNTTGNTLTKATLTQGTSIGITNGNGSITINHADTSNLNGAQGTDGIASITVDGLGHVTAVTTASYITSASLCSSIADCGIDGGTF